MKKFISPLLLVIFGFINIALCAESNSILDRLLSVFRPKVTDSELDSLLSVVGLVPEPDFDSLFPTTSQFDNEIETLLDEIGDSVGYLRKIMHEDHIEENRIKLKKDISNGNLDKDTIKKLKKLCILGIRRNKGWRHHCCRFFLSDTR